jgi:hypothetical protein
MNLNLLWFWLIVLAAFFVYARRAHLKRAIKNPRLGVLDLTHGASEQIRTDDVAALRDLFSSVEISTAAPPACDVLFLYATIEDGGGLLGTDRFLRATIRDAGARVVVVASENPHPRPGQGHVYGHANLVITLARNGPAFPQFFRALFTRMKRGSSMPSAWNRLAPQIPGKDHAGCPATIFLCELGGISFR